MPHKDASPAWEDHGVSLTLAVAALVWVGVLDFRILGNGPAPWETTVFSAPAVGWPGNGFIGLVLGWLAAAAAATGPGRPRRIGRVFLGGAAAAGTLSAYWLLSQQFGSGQGIAVITARLGGTVLGCALWLVAGRQVTDALQPRLQALPATPLLVLIGLVIIFVPAPPQQSLGVTAAAQPSDLLAFVAATPQRIYFLFKDFMLWLPLGFIFAAGGGEHLAKRWGLGAAIAFFLIVWPYLGGITAQEMATVALIPLALWAGAWLGATTRQAIDGPSESLSDPDPAGTSAASSAPVPAGPYVATSSPTIAGAGSEPPKPRGASGAAWLRRAVALIIFTGTVAWALDFPRWPLALAGGLIIYGAVLLRWPQAWLVLIPACVPVLDLAPWTGRFFLDELDLVLTMTVAGALWHGVHPQAGPRLPRLFWVLAGVYVLAYSVSVARGLWPLPPLDENAFVSYWSHWNALRVAKGLFWALVVWMLIRWRVPRDYQPSLKLFVVGSWAGLLGFVAIALRERWQYADIFDFEATYRITGSFSSMHTGGNHIEAYLVMTIPFLWLWISQSRLTVMKALGILAGLAAMYTTLITIARVGIAALAVALTILALGSLRATLRSRALKGTPVPWQAVLILLGLVVIVAGSLGGAMRDRFAQVMPDLQTRLDHWGRTLEMIPADPVSTLFGVGVGRFPASYLIHAATGQGGGVPATYGLAREDGNEFLRLAAGETVYMVQRVNVEPNTDYVIELRLRGTSTFANLAVPVCEKHLLNSFRCEWHGVHVPPDGEWHTRSVQFNSGPIGGRSWLGKYPVDLQLWVSEPDTRVDVDDLSLHRAEGPNVIKNGDFSAGLDYWFPRAHTHLPFHVKNLFVSMRFEQGWLGLMAFLGLTGWVLVRLARASWNGLAWSTVALASLTGFLATGLFGSPLDAPRLSLLFYTYLFLGTLVAEPPDLRRHTPPAGNRPTSADPSEDA